MNNNPLKVVVIGGGHGQSVILRGIKFIQDIQISAIVTVADDGGSTGRLRRQFHIPAMGDIRAVLIALAESETLLKNLMEYRFEGDPDPDQEDQGVMGHNLGNLILTALTQSCGSFLESIGILSKILNVRGDIIPATTQVITLFARMADGTIVRGESNIPNMNNRIDTVFYQETVKASEKASSGDPRSGCHHLWHRQHLYQHPAEPDHSGDCRSDSAVGRLRRIFVQRHESAGGNR